MERSLSLLLGEPVPLPWMQDELLTSLLLLVPLVGRKIFGARSGTLDLVFLP